MPNTLFHRIIIPIKAFDSGLTHLGQPESTEFVFEWYDLSLSDPDLLDGLDLSHSNYPGAEGSIYLGSAHNWCNVKTLKFSLISRGRYRITGELDIDFESEGIGENESFSSETEAAF